MEGEDSSTPAMMIVRGRPDALCIFRDLPWEGTLGGHAPRADLQVCARIGHWMVPERSDGGHETREKED